MYRGFLPDKPHISVRDTSGTGTVPKKAIQNKSFWIAFLFNPDVPAYTFFFCFSNPNVKFTPKFTLNRTEFTGIPCLPNVLAT